MVLAEGAAAPDFVLDTVDGNRYSLSDALAGGPVVLVFFKTTCAACDLTFPYLNRLLSSYPHEGWTLLAIAQDAAAPAGEYARRMGIAFPLLVDGDGYPVSRLYDPPATPTLFLVGRDGRIAYTTHGFSKDGLNKLSNAIAGILDVDTETVALAGDGQPDFRPG